MCCLALSAGFIGPRFALLIWWIFGSKVDAAFSSWIWPLLGLLFLPWTTLAYVLAWGPCTASRASGAGCSSRSGSLPTSRRTRRAPPSRATTRPSFRVVPHPGEDDDVEASVAVLPVRPQHALATEAGPLRETERRDIFRRDEHLHAAETELGERPVRQRHEGLGRDPAASCGRSQAAAELGDPVLAERQHHLAQVRIRDTVGDHEMEETALAPARLIERHHTCAVGCGQFGHPPRCGSILLQRESGVEVVLPKGPEHERGAGERRLGIGNRRVDRVILGGASDPGRCPFTIAQRVTPSG